MNLLWTYVVPAALIVGSAFAAGYYHGRAAGREQGAVDAWRRRAAIERRTR